MGNKFYNAARNNLIKNSNLRTLLGFCVSAFLLWLTFNNSGLTIENINLDGLQLLYFISAVIVFVFSIWGYSVRAKLIWINETTKFSDVDPYSSLIIGNFYNSLLPGKLGEGIRAWHYSKKQHVPFSRSLAAIVMEKWIDAQIFILLTLVLFVLKPFISHYILFTISYTAGATLILSIIYEVMLRNKWAEKKIWLLIILIKKPGVFLFKVYKHTVQHIRDIKTKGATFHYLAICIVIYFLNVIQFLLLLKAAGVANPVGGIYSAYLIALSMMIIAFIPSAPGNVGVLHYGLYSVLILSASQYGIKPDNSDLQSYALFGVYVHLSYFIPEVLIGGFFVIREKKLLFGINK